MLTLSCARVLFCLLLRNDAARNRAAVNHFFCHKVTPWD
jgi:hypothetical protein